MSHCDARCRYQEISPNLKHEEDPKNEYTPKNDKSSHEDALKNKGTSKMKTTYEFREPQKCHDLRE